MKVEKNVIVRLAGGTGNQLFQIAAGHFYAQRTDRTLHFFSQHLSTYTSARESVLNVMGLANQEVDVDRLRECILRHRLNRLVPMPGFVNDGGLLRNYASKTVILDGYFQEAYLIENELKNYIQRLVENVTIDYETIDLTKTDGTIAVHVRLGDYLLPKYRRVFPVVTPEFFERALAAISRRIDTVLVFSQDRLPPSFGRIFERYEVVYVSDFGLTDLQEFALMSGCKHLVMSNSTFSYLAGLHNHFDKSLVAPKHWYHDAVKNKLWQANLKCIGALGI